MDEVGKCLLTIKSDSATLLSSSGNVEFEFHKKLNPCGGFFSRDEYTVISIVDGVCRNGAKKIKLSDIYPSEAFNLIMLQWMFNGLVIEFNPHTWEVLKYLSILYIHINQLIVCFLIF